jgi:hypothetical protein
MSERICDRVSPACYWLFFLGGAFPQGGETGECLHEIARAAVWDKHNGQPESCPHFAEVDDE